MTRRICVLALLGLWPAALPGAAAGPASGRRSGRDRAVTRRRHAASRTTAPGAVKPICASRFRARLAFRPLASWCSGTTPPASGWIRVRPRPQGRWRGRHGGRRRDSGFELAGRAGRAGLHRLPPEAHHGAEPPAGRDGGGERDHDRPYAACRGTVLGRARLSHARNRSRRATGDRRAAVADGAAEDPSRLRSGRHGKRRPEDLSVDELSPDERRRRSGEGKSGEGRGEGRRARTAGRSHDDLPELGGSWPLVRRAREGLTSADARRSEKSPRTDQRPNVGAGKARGAVRFVGPNFRYVSLSLGVGRYQPRPAGDVLRDQYGDCKDKHTLLASLMESVGLRASTVLINSRAKIDADFPSPSQFDHAITRAVADKQDVWLDVTTEIAPFRLLSVNLRKKQALVIPSGSAAHLEETPADPPMPSVAGDGRRWHARRGGHAEGRRTGRRLRGDDGAGRCARMFRRHAGCPVEGSWSRSIGARTGAWTARCRTCEVSDPAGHDGISSPIALQRRGAGYRRPAPAGSAIWRCR